jgi:hypothetical protein
VALVDRIVAVVNKEVITEYELAERITSRRICSAAERLFGSPRDRHQVLERLIIEKVQLQFACRRDALTISGSTAPSLGAEENKLSLTVFRQMLSATGSFDAFREELRNEVL